MLKKINLYYDDECPFCKEYSKFVELRKIFDINIINAREAIVKINRFTLYFNIFQLFKAFSCFKSL